MGVLAADDPFLETACPERGMRGGLRGAKDPHDSARAIWIAQTPQFKIEQLSPTDSQNLIDLSSQWLTTIT